MTANERKILGRFLDLARAGSRWPHACSDGENRAIKLALAAVEYAPGLDEEAIEGFSLFIQAARIDPEAARKCIGV